MMTILFLSLKFKSEIKGVVLKMELFERIEAEDLNALSVVKQGDSLVLRDRYDNVQIEGRLTRTPFDYRLKLKDSYLGEEKELEVAIEDSDKMFQEILLLEDGLNKVREAMRDYRLAFCEE